MTNTPTPPRSRIRSVIPNRICTKPESKAKENMPGLNADNFLGLLERKTKNTTKEIETEIKKICMFVRRGELSASPCRRDNRNGENIHYQCEKESQHSILHSESPLHDLQSWSAQSPSSIAMQPQPHEHIQPTGSQPLPPSARV